MTFNFLPTPPAPHAHGRWQWARSPEEAGHAGVALGRLAGNGRPDLHMGPHASDWHKVAPKAASAHPSSFAFTGRRTGRLFSDNTAVLITGDHVLPYIAVLDPSALPQDCPAMFAAMFDAAPAWSGRVATRAHEAAAGDALAYWAPMLPTPDTDPAAQRLIAALDTLVQGHIFPHVAEVLPGTHRWERAAELHLTLHGAHPQANGQLRPAALSAQGNVLNAASHAQKQAFHAWIESLSCAIATRLFPGVCAHDMLGYNYAYKPSRSNPWDLQPATLASATANAADLTGLSAHTRLTAAQLLHHVGIPPLALPAA